jgi:RNA polymerase sigma-70 factor (ECF subfamily)
LALSTLDDLFLIQQTLNGNRNAFRFLVLRYQKPIFKFLSSFNLSEAIREEVAQETFVRAYKRLDSFEPKKGVSFSTWLFVIAKNLAINETKRHSHLYEITADKDVEKAAEVLTPEASLSQKQTQQAVHNALAQVPEDFRRSLILSQISEHSLEEIAHIENCSVGTVKSRIFRGKEMLRKIIGPNLEVL